MYMINVNGSSINIQIEADDIVKLISGFMSSDTFKKLTHDAIQRSVTHTDKYMNPYHPEDGVEVKYDGKIDSENLKNVKEQTQLKQDENNNNSQLELSLEKENDIFLNKIQDESKDILTDNEPVATALHIESKRSLKSQTK